MNDENKIILKEQILEQIKTSFYDFAKEFPLGKAYEKIDYEDTKTAVHYLDPRTKAIVAYAKYFYQDEEVKPYSLISLNQKEYVLNDYLSLELRYPIMEGYHAKSFEDLKNKKASHDLLSLSYSLYDNSHNKAYLYSGSVYYDLGENPDYHDLSSIDWKSKNKHYFTLSKEELNHLQLDEKSIRDQMRYLEIIVENFIEKLEQEKLLENLSKQMPKQEQNLKNTQNSTIRKK